MMHSVQNCGDLGMTSKYKIKDYVNFARLRPILFIVLELIIGLYQIFFELYSHWILLNYFVGIKYLYGVLDNKHAQQFGNMDQFDDIQQGKQHHHVFILLQPNKYQLIIMELVPTTIVLSLRINASPTQRQQPWRFYMFNALLDQKILQRFCLAMCIQLHYIFKQHTIYIVGLLTGSDKCSFVKDDNS